MWLQIGYKNPENTEKINIFIKYDNRKPRKHAIGELIKAVDALGGEPKFVYDSLGQITLNQSDLGACSRLSRV